MAFESGHPAEVSEATIAGPALPKRETTRLGASWMIRALLASVVLLAAAVWGAAATLTPVPWIFPDELIYSEMAKSIASGAAPAIRGTTSFAFGPLYPLTIAPAWLWNDIETSYAVARWINALVMASTAVPLYYLARRHMADGRALLVGVIGVALPSMAYVGTLMTEVAFYPTFVLALLALDVALERPSVRNQLGALTAIGFAFLAKSSAVALVPAYFIAIAVVAATEARPFVATLREYMWSWSVVGGVLLVALFIGTARSGDPAATFGSYSVVVHHIDLIGSARWFVGNLSALALYTGAVPLAAALIVWPDGLAAGERRRRAFAALSAATVVSLLAIVAVVGAYVSDPAPGDLFQATSPIQERNTFVVTPLLLIALVLSIESGIRVRRAAKVVGLISLAFVLLLPWGSVPHAANPQDLATFAFLGASSSLLKPVLAGTVAAFLLCLWWFLPRRKIGYLWMSLGAWFAFVGAVAVLVFAHAGDLTAAWVEDHDRGWIDDSVPAGASVAIVWHEPGDGAVADINDRQRIVWLNEFFNRSVGPVYETGAAMPFDLPALAARIEGEVLETAGADPIRANYVLVRCPFALDGVSLGTDEASGARLYRTSGSVTFEPDLPCAGLRRGRADDRR